MVNVKGVSNEKQRYVWFLMGEFYNSGMKIRLMEIHMHSSSPKLFLVGGRNSEEDYGCLATIIVGPVPEKRGLYNCSTQKQRNITRGWNTFAA
jgi:hypothetical protein